MNNMQLRGSYKAAAQAGLDVKPGSKPVGILASGVKGWGQRGFDSLKIGRLDLWDLWSQKFPEMLRDEAGAKELAKEINIATGGLERGSVGERIASKTTGVSFAPKLFIARRLEALTPIRYAAKAGKMLPSERAAMNIAMQKWAKITVGTAALLGANDLYNKFVGGGKHRVNWDDFSQPGSLWRMNIGGTIIPVTPMVEVIRTPVAALAALVANRKQLRGQDPKGVAWDIATRDILNAVHPSITAGIELATGREEFRAQNSLFAVKKGRKYRRCHWVNILPKKGQFRCQRLPASLYRPYKIKAWINQYRRRGCAHYSWVLKMRFCLEARPFMLTRKVRPNPVAAAHQSRASFRSRFLLNHFHDSFEHGKQGIENIPI